MSKVDVYNRSERLYDSPTGVKIPSHSTVALESDEALAMMKNYPRDLISPDSLRSIPSAQSNKDQHDLIVALQGRISALETEVTALTKDKQALLAELSAVKPATIGVSVS